MGYSILGIIIFLLLLVFINDLVRSGNKEDEPDFDAKEYYQHLDSNFTYGEEFSEDFIDGDDESYYENKGDS